MAVGVSTVYLPDPNNGGQEQYTVGAHCHPETTVANNECVCVCVCLCVQDLPVETLSSSHAATHGTIYSLECIYRHYKFKIPPSVQQLKCKTVSLMGWSRTNQSLARSTANWNTKEPGKTAVPNPGNYSELRCGTPRTSFPVCSVPKTTNKWPCMTYNMLTDRLPVHTVTYHTHTTQIHKSCVTSIN